MDDIRVRAVAMVIAHKQTPIPKSVSQPEVETVECIKAYIALLHMYSMYVRMYVCTFEKLSWQPCEV